MSFNTLSVKLAALTLALLLPAGCGSAKPSVAKKPAVTVVPLPAVPSASDTPQAPPPRKTAEEACAAIDAETREQIGALVVKGFGEWFDEEVFPKCTRVGDAVVTVSLEKGAEVAALPGLEDSPCMRGAFWLVASFGGDDIAPQPLGNNVFCGYEPTISAVDVDHDGRLEVLVEESGLELGDVALQRIFPIERARIFELREHMLIPYTGIESFEKGLNALGNTKFEVSGRSTYLLGVMDGGDAEGLSLRYEILRIRLGDCGLRDWLDCPNMPGLQLSARPVKGADGTVSFPFLTELGPDKWSDVVLGVAPTTTSKGKYSQDPEQIATLVSEAFAKMVMSKVPKAPPASVWTAARKKYCLDPAQCFYFDEVEFAFARWAEALQAGRVAKRKRP